MDYFSYKIEKTDNTGGLNPETVTPVTIKAKVPPQSSDIIQLNTGSGVNVTKNSEQHKPVIPPSVDYNNINELKLLIEQLNFDISKNATDIFNLTSIVHSLKIVADLSSAKFHIHMENVPKYEWIINHRKGGINLTYFLVDTEGFQILPDEFQIVNGDLVIVRFTAPQDGKVILVFC